MTRPGALLLGKEVSSMRIRSLVLVLGVVLCAAFASWGCGKGGTAGTTINNTRPTVELSSAPIEGDTTFYSVRLNWFGSDADGQVTRYMYAEDPVPGQDTAWVETSASETVIFWNSPGPTDPLPPLGSVIISRGYHTFVIKAVDNENLASAPVSRSFTSRTVAPSTQITRPRPNDQQPVSVVPSVTIDWIGTDPDGEISQRPLRYSFMLVPASDINPNNPGGITALQIQEFFGAYADEQFASWESVSGDTTSRFFEGLSPQTTYYFAIVAFDEAGAFEPRFTLTSNVLQFRPTLDRLGPVITVFNQFFARTQGTGGISLAPSRIVNLEFPADSQIPFFWFATPPRGAEISGYRWAVDIENQDITNETEREDDDDIRHWSSWSLNELGTSIGPFAGSLDSTIVHYFYLEARDNLGFVSLYTIRLKIVKPRFDKRLLVIDDAYGTASGRPLNMLQPYPMEAEADSFYYSVGGFPDSIGILRNDAERNPNAISEPGIFADFGPDTLDYRFYQEEGILLSKLTEYKVLVWYTDGSSSSRTGAKFGSLNPATAIRLINSVNRLNTLAVYMRQANANGGRLWVLGEGMTGAIANGYVSRIPLPVARLPYTSGEDPRVDILREGNFLWDFCHLRSELNTAGTVQSQLTLAQQLKFAIPYLPEFALEPGQPMPEDRSLDPRIGPSAAKTAIRWSGLPRLTIANYRTANPDPELRSIGRPAETWVITRPLFVTEGSGANFRSVLDTLYLCQARELDLTSARIPPSDGFPNAVHYYGSEHGEVVWMGFSLYFFERDQARQVADKVFRNFGLVPVPAGQRGAHPASFGEPRIVDENGYGTDFVESPVARRGGRP